MCSVFAEDTRKCASVAPAGTLDVRHLRCCRRVTVSLKAKRQDWVDSRPSRTVRQVAAQALIQTSFRLAQSGGRAKPMAKGSCQSGHRGGPLSMDAAKQIKPPRGQHRQHRLGGQEASGELPRPSRPAPRDARRRRIACPAHRRSLRAVSPFRAYRTSHVQNAQQRISNQGFDVSKAERVHGAQRIDLVLEGGAISEQHRRDLATDTLLDRLSVVVARLIPDPIEALRANAARKFRSNLENSTGRTSSTCLLPISEARNDQGINQSADRSRTPSDGRQGRSNGLNAETLTQLDHGTSAIRLDRPRGDARPPDPRGTRQRGRGPPRRSLGCAGVGGSGSARQYVKKVRPPIPRSARASSPTWMQSQSTCRSIARG